MVAFTPEGLRQFHLMVKNGDSAVKEVSGLQEEIAQLTDDLMRGLPSEPEAKLLFEQLQDLSRRKRSGENVLPSELQGCVLNILRRYPALRDILQNHLQVNLPESMPCVTDLAYALTLFIDSEQTFTA